LESRNRTVQDHWQSPHRFGSASRQLLDQEQRRSKIAVAIFQLLLAGLLEFEVQVLLVVATFLSTGYDAPSSSPKRLIRRGRVPWRCPSYPAP
jgi:hypothetical protein